MGSEITGSVTTGAQLVVEKAAVPFANLVVNGAITMADSAYKVGTGTVTAALAYVRADGTHVSGYARGEHLREADARQADREHARKYRRRRQSRSRRGGALGHGETRGASI